MQEDEGRRFRRRQPRGVGFGQTVARQPYAGARPRGGERGTGAVDDGDGNKPRDGAPAPPAVELTQIVGAHQPDEAHMRRAARQPEQSVVGVALADVGLDAGDDDARMGGDAAGLRHAFGERRQIGRPFQRIAGRRQPPDRVEPQAFQRDQAQQPMAGVGGIERTAEQANAVAGLAARQSGEGGAGGRGQGKLGMARRI